MQGGNDGRHPDGSERGRARSTELRHADGERTPTPCRFRPSNRRGGARLPHESALPAPGQPADRLQLLDLPHLLFQSALLCHVLDIAFYVLAAVCVLDERT